MRSNNGVVRLLALTTVEAIAELTTSRLPKSLRGRPILPRDRASSAYPEGDHVCFNISYKCPPLTGDWMAARRPADADGRGVVAAIGRRNVWPGPGHHRDGQAARRDTA
jgi:hypothetical protein